MSFALFIVLNYQFLPVSATLKKNKQKNPKLPAQIWNIQKDARASDELECKDTVVFSFSFFFFLKTVFNQSQLICLVSDPNNT